MQTTQLVLNITKCPEDHTGTKVIDIPKSGGSIGRSSLCTVILPDNDRFISSSHCLIHIYGGTYYISDVSTNGTFVNGLRIAKNQPISIHDGDSIALGRYEMLLCFEMSSQGQDIAADILTQQRETSDPLLYFEEFIPLDENEASDLDALFMETKGREIDKDDPLAHMDFSSIENNDTLINDVFIDKENAQQKDNPPHHHALQFQDDSDSIFAHFETPTFITEDWIKNPLENSPPIALSSKAIEPSLLMGVENGVYWEDLDKQACHAQKNRPYSKAKTQKVNIPSSQVKNSQKNKKTSKDLSIAFFKGLGVSYPHSADNDPNFFQHMGAALRMCIDKLQEDILDVETLKSGKGDVKSENVLELMLALNEQNLLTPNELIEQILDELDEHKIHAKQAIKEAICAELKTYDPTRFEQQQSSRSLFMTKRQLWRQYEKFFSEKSKKVNDLSATSAKKKAGSNH